MEYKETLDTVRFEQYRKMLADAYAAHQIVPGVNSAILHMILLNNEAGEKVCITLFTNGDTLTLTRKDIEGMITDGQ